MSNNPFFSVLLKEAAAKSHDLLTTLHQTEYASAALVRNTQYVADLKNELTITHGRFVQCKIITEDERKDHLKHRDSVLRRFASRLGGAKGKEKYNEKVEKEEREFLEAWQNEREAERRLSEIRQALADAEDEGKTLDSVKDAHTRAQAELDSLYERIFDGPTPALPEEDAQEDVVRSARQDLARAEDNLHNHQRALAEIQDAQDCLNQATQNIGSAESASTWEMWGGGLCSDFQERNSLSEAQIDLGGAQRHLAEARRYNPALGSINEVDLPQRSIMTDILYDNLYSNYRQNQRIVDSERQANASALQLDSMKEQQEETIRVWTAEVDRAKDTLDRARRQLQNIRVEAVETFSGAGAAKDSTQSTQHLIPSPTYPA